MKTNELMIGDLVETPKGNYRVLGVHEDCVYTDFNNGEGAESIFFEDDVRPIPLTTEILEKNGFYAERNVGYVYEDGCDYEIVFNTFDKKLRILYNRDVVLDIEEWDFPVHKLQHALRLCGVEKEIILEG